MGKLKFSELKYGDYIYRVYYDGVGNRLYAESVRKNRENSIFYTLHLLGDEDVSWYEVTDRSNMCDCNYYVTTDLNDAIEKYTEKYTNKPENIKVIMFDEHDNKSEKEMSLYDFRNALVVKNNVALMKERLKENMNDKCNELLFNSDEDKLATEIHVDNLCVKAPSGYMIGNVTPTDKGYLIEYVKK